MTSAEEIAWLTAVFLVPCDETWAFPNVLPLGGLGLVLFVILLATHYSHLFRIKKRIKETPKLKE